MSQEEDKPAVPYFLQIVVRAKSEIDNDWRSFLQWADRDEMMVYEIRGYGQSSGEASEDAYKKFKEDAQFYAEDHWEWKD